MTTTDSNTQHPALPQIPVRLDFDAHAPGFARALAHLDQAATKELDRAGVDSRLRELVRVRASQLNGCAYCIDMHTKDARAIGEAEQRLYALPAWRETPFFTERERAEESVADSEGRTGGGGLILIGPFPIVFGGWGRGTRARRLSWAFRVAILLLFLIAILIGVYLDL